MIIVRIKKKRRSFRRLKYIFPFEKRRGPKRLGPLRFSKGKMYFSRRNERRFFFILTIIMLAVAIAGKIGLFF